jgi:cytochrome c biogenesis protein CcmG/thiol:disulfide interchange protein DsbE
MEEIKGSVGFEGSEGSEGSSANGARGSTARTAGVIVTAVALLAIAIPFVWSPNEEAAADTDSTASTAATPESTPVAAHAPEESGAACMANAKPANYDFTMKDVDGNDVSLSAYKGKVVLLNFWATWCGPCKAEIPGFVKLQEKYRDKGLVIVGYSVDDTADKAKAYAAQYKMNYPILLGEGREDVQDAYGPIWGIPASFIISRDGKVCRKHLGIAPEAVFEKEVVPLL